MANLLSIGDYRKDVLYQPNLPIRPRSLFTNPHACISSNEESNYTRYPEYTKFFDNPPGDQWSTGINLNTIVPNNTNISNNNCIANWRQNNRSNAKVISTSIYPQDDYLYSECGVELWPFQDTWRETDFESGGLGTAFTTQHGTISLRLLDRVRLDMTVDRAIRILNFKSNIVIALSSNGSSTALLHPNGRIFQYGSRVEILANDNHGNNKYAKMWYKGVSFTSEQCALVYLVDAAGTRTTTDTFWDMSQDLSLTVFYNDSRHGAGSIQEAGAILQSIQYWLSEEGIHNWIINNVRISQTPDGLVRLARNSNKYLLRTSPTNGTASLTTPFLHCTASLGQTSHLFVRRGERRMHYDGTSFIVRNAGHSAGFDEKNQLKVY